MAEMSSGAIIRAAEQADKAG